jgi:hypothetical protein
MTENPLAGLGFLDCAHAYVCSLATEILVTTCDGAGATSSVGCWGGISLDGTWEVPVRTVMEVVRERNISEHGLEFGASA